LTGRKAFLILAVSKKEISDQVFTPPDGFFWRQDKDKRIRYDFGYYKIKEKDVFS